MKGTLVIDIETHSINLFWSLKPETYFRLGGYMWLDPTSLDEEPVVITSDLEEMRAEIRKARCIIGHNINDFDLPAIFGVKSDEPLLLTMEKRVYDTWTHGVLVNPAPFKYINRDGLEKFTNTPEKIKSWFSLDEQAFQLGVGGKTDNLKALAKEFQPKNREELERLVDEGRLPGEYLDHDLKDAGFALIPLDDPRYRAYLEGDVRASKAVAMALLAKGPLDGYALREQELEARKFVIRANGFRVDEKVARKRIDALAARRQVIMDELVEKYGFPTEGKAPWNTTAGKAAIMAALADAGVTEKTRRDWPRTGNGALQLGGDVLLSITKDTPAEALGQALAELKGQRSLAQLALDSVQPDGFAHPDITMLQRSGRWSTTKPGLTVWTARGEGAVEKEYFIPDNEDQVLIGLDASNADARVVCWLSGDAKYAERFQPGQDGHLINALAAWGAEKVLASPEATAKYRQMGKPLGHGWSYGGGWKTLSRESGVPEKESKEFCDGMAKAFPRIIAWQNAVRRFASQHGYVVSQWGRKLYVEKGREFTQAPALLGQNGTREIIADALLAMPIHVLRTVKAQIHDELVYSVPRKHWEACRDVLTKIMECNKPAPKGGLPMEFPMGCGPAGENWYQASH